MSSKGGRQLRDATPGSDGDVLEGLDTWRYSCGSVCAGPRHDQHGGRKEHGSQPEVDAMANRTSAIGNFRDHGCGIFCVPLTGCINILTPTHELSWYVTLGLTNPVLARQSTLAYRGGHDVRTCNRSFGIRQACVAAALVALVQAGFGGPATAADLAPAGRCARGSPLCATD